MNNNLLPLIFVSICFLSTSNSSYCGQDINKNTHITSSGSETPKENCFDRVIQYNEKESLKNIELQDLIPF